MILAITEQQLYSRTQRIAELLTILTQEVFHVEVVSAGDYLRRAQFGGAGANLERVLSNRGYDEFAAMLDLGAQYNLYMAFEEAWHMIPPGENTWQAKLLKASSTSKAEVAPINVSPAPSRQFVFDGARIRFYVGPGPQAQQRQIFQWLRCEWEPCKETMQASSTDKETVDEILDTISFDAVVAAHPHIQVDTFPLNAQGRRMVQSFQANTANAGQQDSWMNPAQTFGGDFIDSGWTSFKDMHLPVGTTWHAAEPPQKPLGDASSTLRKLLPHQRYPQSLQELDNWFCWSTDYIRHEFGKYLKDS